MAAERRIYTFYYYRFAEKNIKSIIRTIKQVIQPEMKIIAHIGYII